MKVFTHNYAKEYRNELLRRYARLLAPTQSAYAKNIMDYIKNPTPENNSKL
jgi:hypothetical protein